MTDTSSAAAGYNREALAARWTAVVNDEIGGWAVSIDGRTPADGGVMAADVMTRELAEHIAALHNQWLTTHTVTVRPAVALVRGDCYDVTPLVLPLLDPEQFVERHRQTAATFGVPDCGRTNQTPEVKP